MHEPFKISPRALDVLEDPENAMLVSSASIWELSIKIGNGRLLLRENAEENIHRSLLRLKMSVLPVSASHALGVMHLPLHHRDPFDRLLISQCHVEGIPLVSIDPMMRNYGIQVIW